ncbi:MAG: nicotinate (nicotinamide) nucleotide adenylyltransferase [Acidobacteriaceae bacterium]|nr:nicotinate (nicotinamide) nucleotide adenylyltransferase [Acidobacteriaceae bacterium]MBV8569166.1 nicotinate (nicotinamide) nucleotide adenylyltransferase [Acidobacteriaceae bacterium]
MPERICLFGGTFDPIHNAHLRIAQEALKCCSLDRILFIPAGNPPHKDSAGVTPYEDRFRMVELACEPYPAFEASRLEAGSERSYTIDTIKRMRETLAPGDRLFFLIGSDAFDEIETWKGWQELIRLLEFIVVARPGGQYRIPEGARLQQVGGLSLPVSSSGIRARLAESGPTPELPKKVRAFIEERGLYGFGERKATALL